jgi:hypothetical protein
MYDASAREYERARTVPVDDGQFQIAVEWCVRYSLPIHVDSIRPLFDLGVDPYQNRKVLVGRR